MSILQSEMVERTCSFQSKNPNDTVSWVGIIEGVALSSRLASRDENVVAYNAAVRQVDPSVPADVSQLHFFAISLESDTGGYPDIKTFAEEWLVAGSFKLTDQLAVATITVPYDPSTQSTSDILATLINAGYVSAAVSSVDTSQFG